MAEAPATTIEHLLTCSLCLELFKEPKTLTCLHSYCKECLIEMTKKTKKCDSVVCPLCREETAKPESGIEGLPTNFFIKNLLEVVELRSQNESLLCSNCEDGLKAIVRCAECNEFFCQKCHDAHSLMKQYQEHRVVDLKKLSSPTSSKDFHPAMKCLTHSFDCKFFCRSCNVLVCRDCTVVDHPVTSHSVANLKDVAKLCREKSLEALAKADKHVAIVKQVQSTLQKKKEKFQTTVDMIQAQVKERKDYLIQQFTQAVEGRSSEMTSQLQQLLIDNVEQNERDEGQIEADLKKMTINVLFMRNLQANGNDDEMMDMYDYLATSLNDTSSRSPFWLRGNTQSTPVPEWLTEADEDVVKRSVDRLVTTCLGEVLTPAFQADDFELVEERGKVFDVGKGVEVTVKPSNRRSKQPTVTPPDLNLFQAKVLTPKQTVIHCKLQLNDDSTISMHFTSYIKGRHRLAVQLQGNSVRGGPLTLDVKGESDYSRGTSLLQKLPLDQFESTKKLVSVRADHIGNIYIQAGSIIQVFDSFLHHLYDIQLIDAVKKPWDFAIDEEGKIIVSDTGGHKLFVFKTDGTFLHEIGVEGNDPGQLSAPLGVAVDFYGNIGVCDAGNRRIQLFNADGSFKLCFTDRGEEMYPVTLRFNSQGEIIVSESSLWFYNYRPREEQADTFDAANAVECIKVFNRAGEVLFKFGGPGQEPGQFWAPITLAVDHCDLIWVADFTYGSVQVFDRKGNVKAVFASDEKEKGAGWISTMATASNGAVLYYRSLFEV